jgi:hypothetical protein
VVTGPTPGQAYRVGDRVSVAGTIVGVNNSDSDWVNVEAFGAVFTVEPSGHPDISRIAAMADPRTVALDPALLHKELHEVIAERDELRELLDGIGVTAANAPEDGDSFGLLEEIAMRIAAASVPDSTPIDEWPDPDNPVTGRTPGASAEPDTARALDLARDEITSVRNVLARVLGEFKRSGSGHSARLGQMTIARAYRDGGLPLPDDLAGIGE